MSDDDKVSLKEFMAARFDGLEQKMLIHREGRDKEISTLFKKIEHLDAKHYQHIKERHTPMENRQRRMETMMATITGGGLVLWGAIKAIGPIRKLFE